MGNYVDDSSGMAKQEPIIVQSPPKIEKLIKNRVNYNNIIKFRRSVQNSYGLKPQVNLINAYDNSRFQQ